MTKKIKFTEEEIEVQLDQYKKMSHDERLDVWNTLYIKINNIAADHGRPFDTLYMSAVLDGFTEVLIDDEKYEVLTILKDFRDWHQL